MRAIHLSFRGMRHAFKAGARFDSHGVEHSSCSSSSVRPIVLDISRNLAGNILNQRAAEKHVEALNAVADREHGFLLRKCVLEQSEIGPLAIGVRIGTLGMPSSTEPAGHHVRRAAGQQNPVERPRQFFPGAEPKFQAILPLAPHPLREPPACIFRDL